MFLRIRMAFVTFVTIVKQPAHFAEAVLVLQRSFHGIILACLREGGYDGYDRSRDRTRA